MSKKSITYYVICIVALIVIIQSIWLLKTYTLILELQGQIESKSNDNKVDMLIESVIKLEEEMRIANDRIDSLTELENLLTSHLELDEIILMLDKLRDSDIGNLKVNQDSMRMHLMILRENIHLIDNMEVIYANQVIDVKSEGSINTLNYEEYGTNDIQSIECSNDLKIYAGGEGFIHETTMQNLITPGEPLETGIFTLIKVEGKLKYIFTGRTH